MKKQNYDNHIRFYPIHHFVFYPFLGILLTFTLLQVWRNADNRLEWAIIAIVEFMVGWLSFMLRQHYALMNQNRIVRLEMRLRFFQLTGKRFEPIEAQLSFGQIAALRFASDEELEPLIERTLLESLNADAIKRSVKNWQADHMRV